MKNPIGGGNGMVPHYSGTTLDAQARYANGAKKILENYFTGAEQNPPDIIIGKTGYETKACKFVICLSISFSFLSITLASQMVNASKTLQCLVYPFCLDEACAASSFVKSNMSVQVCNILVLEHHAFSCTTSTVQSK